MKSRRRGQRVTKSTPLRCEDRVHVTSLTRVAAPAPGKLSFRTLTNRPMRHAGWWHCQSNARTCYPNWQRQPGLTCKPTCKPACLHWIQTSVDQKLPLIAVSQVLLFQSGDTGNRVTAMGDKTLIDKPARELVTQSNPAGLGQTHRLALVTAEAIEGAPAQGALVRTPTRAHQRNIRQAKAQPQFCSAVQANATTGAW
jgi:hypothetical protein